MKLIPATLRNLQAMSWQGAVTPLEYQRLTLRLYLAALQFSLAVALVIIPIAAIARFFPAVAASFAQVHPLVYLLNFLIAVPCIAFSLWYFIVNVKVVLLRTHGLGLSTRKAILAIFVLAVLGLLVGSAGYVRENSLLIALGYVPMAFVRLIPVISALGIIGALCTYWMNFETTPLCNTKSKPVTPFAVAPDKFEKACLFILQFWLWFTILSAPLHAIFNY